MTYTPFGEYLRILRIKHHQVMGDLAEELNVSLPFLSAVETGKKNIPSDWVAKIVKLYQLNQEEIEQIKEAAEASKTQYKIPTLHAGRSQRLAAYHFTKSFSSMDEETAEEILNLLCREKK